MWCGSIFNEPLESLLDVNVVSCPPRSRCFTKVKVGPFKNQINVFFYADSIQPRCFTLEEKEHSSDCSDPPLQNVVFSSNFRTLHSCERSGQPKRSKYNGSDHEGPGGLNVSCEPTKIPMFDILHGLSINVQ